MIAIETLRCIISKKCVTHIFAAETFTCINAIKRSTNIIVEESTTDIIAIELQNLHKIATDDGTCIIAIESVSCIVATGTATCRVDYRNFHLQKWCQSEIIAIALNKFSE